MIDALHIIAIVLSIILMIALEDIHRVREWHHGYYGAALFGLQFAFGWPIWTLYVAVVFLLDDDVQHVAEALGLVPRYSDFTPIHRIGAWIVGLFQRKKGQK